MVVLKKKSWYMWILKTMWGLDYSHYKTLCPLFWSIILSIIIFIPWLLIWKPFVFIILQIDKLRGTAEKKLDESEIIKKSKKRAENLYEASNFILKPIGVFIMSYLIIFTVVLTIITTSIGIIAIGFVNFSLTALIISAIIGFIILFSKYVYPIIKFIVKRYYKFLYDIFMIIKERYCPLIKWEG